MIAFAMLLKLLLLITVLVILMEFTNAGSECEKQRDSANQRRRGRLGSFVPRCEQDGSFSKMQCHSSTGYCHCADPQTGKPKTAATRDSGTLKCA
ncbi:equistatin-like [Argiope bruennichi]|uniref:equistatin-like n=1 Tax=Argiope bruennichi TaxID=94029 RepID=UPI0024946289|nr:equistatin-like [Argiope bruennichi]